MEAQGTQSGILLERMVKARQRAGLKLKEASKSLGFGNYQTLSAIEKGKRKVTATELLAMARLYAATLEYFFEPQIPPEPQPLWRRTNEAKTGDIERRFVSFLRQYKEVEELLDLPERWKKLRTNYARRDFDANGFSLAKELARDTGRRLNLGAHPAFDLLNVCENDLGLKILHLELPPGISGACVVEEKLGAGVLINALDAPWRRNFDLAHELFHIITWDLFSREEVGELQARGRKTRPEQYADAFASALLMPEEHLLQSFDEKASKKVIRIADLIELGTEFGVSTEAVLWRLVGLGIVGKRSAEGLLRDPRFKERDRKLRTAPYAQSSPTRYPARYVYLVCRCLAEGRISRGLFAQYLDLDRSEIDSFLEEAGFPEGRYEKISAAGR